MRFSIKNTVLVLFLFFSSIAYAQTNMEDVVYLKNGGILRGMIIEHVPNQSIKIQTADRNVFPIRYDEIEKMTKEALPETKTVKNLPSEPANYKKSGFFSLIEMGYGSGVGDIKIDNYTASNDDYYFGFRTVNGAQLNEHFTLGLGLGIEKYKNASLIPISIDTRASLLKGKVSPVVGLNAGYAIGLDEASNGLTINPIFGIKTYINNNAAFFFNLGYKWQQQDVTYYTGYYYYYFSEQTKKVSFQFITVNTGFSF